MSEAPEPIRSASQLAPEAAGGALHLVLDALAVLADVGDAPGGADAVQALQRRLGLEPTGEVTPALLARARAAVAAVHAEAEAEAARVAEEAAALYEQIAGDREREIEASRARHPARPTCLTEEEVGASRLAAARSALQAADHWRRAAASREHEGPAAPPDLRLRAAQARARARGAAASAVPWFRSAAAGHLAGGDRLQGSRALEGALKAAALAAEASAPLETWP